MRKKRYFAAEVMHSSAMRALPTGAVVAYMDLCLAADDDGFVYDPVGTARASGGSETELEMLCTAGFVLRFENCALIRHWFGQNPKNKWRHTPTAFTEELARVELGADGVWNLKQGAAPVNGEVSTQVITDVTAPVSAQVPAEVISPARTKNGAGGEDRPLTALPKAAETERMADRTAERIAPVTSQVTAGVISPVLSQVTSEGIRGVPPSRAYIVYR